jgi:hypothetical protein
MPRRAWRSSWVAARPNERRIGEEGVTDLRSGDRGEALGTCKRSTDASTRWRAVGQTGFELRLARPEHLGGATPTHRCGGHHRGLDCLDATVKILVIEPVRGLGGERDNDRESPGDVGVCLAGADRDPPGGLAQQAGLTRVEPDHPAAHGVTEALAQQELGFAAQARGDQRERDHGHASPDQTRSPRRCFDRSGHPADQIRVVGEEPLGGPDTDPLIVEAASQHRLCRRVRVDQADIVAKRVNNNVIAVEHGHRPITARAAANSAASASGARCTYLTWMGRCHHRHEADEGADEILHGHAAMVVLATLNDVLVALEWAVPIGGSSRDHSRSPGHLIAIAVRARLGDLAAAGPRHRTG